MLLCPIRQPLRMTQGFGLRPEVYAQFGMKGHNGIDFAGAFAGDIVPCYSPIEGYITLKNDGARGYGKHVIIRSKQLDGSRRRKEVVLGHLSSIDSKWKTGMFIPLGGRIGMIGTTGFSSGVHIHCGLRFLNAAGVVLNANNGFAGYVDFLQWVIYW